MAIHILIAEFTVVLTGATGNGKSAACNFFMQKQVFESRHPFLSVSEKAESEVATVEGKRIKLIDTPGFLDPMSIEEENDRLEFAKALINMKYGFHALGLVLNIEKHIEAAEDRVFKNLLTIYEHYLPYVILIFTHGKFLGNTEEEQKTKLQHTIKNLKEEDKTSNFCRVLEKINYRYITLESVNPMEQSYHASKSKELVRMIDTIFKQTGKSATNEFALSIAENLKKAEVPINQLELLKELADSIKVAIEAMMAADSNDFFTFLRHTILNGEGRILATLLSTAYRYASAAYGYASTAYSYASSAAKKWFQ